MFFNRSRPFKLIWQDLDRTTKFWIRILQAKAKVFAVIDLLEHHLSAMSELPERHLSAVIELPGCHLPMGQICRGVTYRWDRSAGASLTAMTALLGPYLPLEQICQGVIYRSDWSASAFLTAVTQHPERPSFIYCRDRPAEVSLTAGTVLRCASSSVPPTASHAVRLPACTHGIQLSMILPNSYMTNVGKLEH